MIAGWILIAVVAIIAVILLVWAAWQALLLRYQEEPDAHEIHSVKTKDAWDIKLFRYKPRGDKGEPVFLCHGAFANHTNFTKPRGACLVDTLLDHGYDCWLIDLRGTRSSEPALGRKRTSVQMDDYLLYDVPAALAFIRQVTGYPQVHWIGHSLGGMLLYAHVLLHGTHYVADGVTLGSPIGFKGTKISKNRLLLKLVRSFPHLIGAIMRTAGRVGKNLHPRSNAFPINWRNLHRQVRGRDLFNMIETPPTRMTQELSDWATSQSWRMNGGELDVAGNLHQLDIPLFAIYGAADPFVPVQQALEFVQRLPHPNKQIMVLGKDDGFAADYNHVDLAFGAEGVDEVYEPIAAWLLQNPLAKPQSRDDADREGKAFLARRPPIDSALEAEARTVSVAAYPIAVSPSQTDGRTGKGRASRKTLDTSRARSPRTTSKRASAKKKARTRSASPARRSSATPARKRKAARTSAKASSNARPAKKKAAAKKTSAKRNTSGTRAKRTTARKPSTRKAAAPKKRIVAKKKPIKKRRR